MPLSSPILTLRKKRVTEYSIILRLKKLRLLTELNPVVITLPIAKDHDHALASSRFDHAGVLY